MKQWGQSLLGEVSGTDMGVFVSAKWHESFKEQNLYWFNFEEEDDPQRRKMAAYRVLNNLLISIMPTSAVEETYKALLQILEFHSAIGNLPKQSLELPIFSSKTTGVIIRPESAFFPE